MSYKMNGGRGAVICEMCRVMIDADITYKEWEDIYQKANPDGDICWKCLTGYKEPVKEKKEDLSACTRMA